VLGIGQLESVLDLGNMLQNLIESKL